MASVHKIEALLDAVSGFASLARRIEAISQTLLGTKYAENTLTPHGKPEKLVVRLDAFDCVTYIETVLALAFSESRDDFRPHLRELRYLKGQVGWETRNHYMVDWVRNNASQGRVTDLTSESGTAKKTRFLKVVPGIPHRRVNIRYFPLADLDKAKSLMRTGDMAIFVSTRPGLDVFHAGFLVRSGRAWMLRHASRLARKVIDQPLDEFINANKMLGLIIFRARQKSFSSRGITPRR